MRKYLHPGVAFDRPVHRSLRRNVGRAAALAVLAVVTVVGAGCSHSSKLTDSSSCTDFLKASDNAQKEAIRRIGLAAHNSEAGNPLLLANVPYECGQTPTMTLGEAIAMSDDPGSGSASTNGTPGSTPGGLAAVLPTGYPAASGPNDRAALAATWSFLAAHADKATIHLAECVASDDQTDQGLADLIKAHPTPQRIDGFGEDGTGTARVHQIADYKDGDPQHPDGGENFVEFQFLQDHWFISSSEGCASN